MPRSFTTRPLLALFAIALSLTLVGFAKGGGARLSAGSQGTFGGFQNAAEWSTAYTPFAATSIWNTPVSANPTVLASSAAIVAAQFPTTPPITIRSSEAGPNDYAHPTYYAKASDPEVTVNCTGSGGICNHTDNGGYPPTIHIPAVARPAGGTDHHLIVIQPNGDDIETWNTTEPSGDWGTPGNTTITASTFVNCGNLTYAIGYAPNVGASMSSVCLRGGLVTANEFAAGTINHALYLFGRCNKGQQFPTTQYFLNQCSGTGPPMGGRMWYDVPCATTQAIVGLAVWEKALLCALNVYGGYWSDTQTSGTNATGFQVEVESDGPWYTANGLNYTSPYSVLTGWQSQVISGSYGLRWYASYNWNPWARGAGGGTMATFITHIFWLDPCSAQGTC